MKLADLPTPCLVLDRTILERNLIVMANALSRLGVPLRPHMKTAKSIDVARLAIEGQPGGITVSTLAEAEYFAGHGITDILYAVGITPQKLDQIAKQHLFIETLETQHSDRLDFHDVSVWAVKAALQAAFEAGQQSHITNNNQETT